MAETFDGVTWENRAGKLIDDLRESYSRIAGEDGPSEAEIAEAVRTLAAAWDRMRSAVEEASRDEAVRRHLENALTSLQDAAGTALSEVIPAMSGSSSEEVAG